MLHLYPIRGGGFALYDPAAIHIDTQQGPSVEDPRGPVGYLSSQVTAVQPSCQCRVPSVGIN